MRIERQMFAITEERYIEVTFTDNSHKMSSIKTDSLNDLGS
jgi:hypothetical protein